MLSDHCIKILVCSDGSLARAGSILCLVFDCSSKYISGFFFRCSFFLSEPVAFRRVCGLESYSRTSGQSNHHRQSASDTRVPRYQLHHEDDSSSSGVLVWSTLGDIGEEGPVPSSGASCALGRLDGMSRVGSTRQASKNRIPGRGVTSWYGPARSRIRPLRAWCKPDRRETYVGREERSTA